MTLRSGIALGALVVALSGLALCQPPRPRIANVELPPVPSVDGAETNHILTASRQAERVTRPRGPDGPLILDVSRHR